MMRCLCLVLMGAALLLLAACSAAAEPTATATVTAVASIPTTLPTTPPAPTAVPTIIPVPTPTASPTAVPSPDAAAVPQTNGHSALPRISADGQVVAFTSTGNLTGNATSGKDAVFVRDLAAGTIELINQTIDGRAGRWPVYGMALSGNGRVVAYFSHDGDLVPGDEMDCGIETQPESCEDLFIHDRDSGLTERLPLGRSMGLGGDYTLALSGDGRFLAHGTHIYDRETGLTSEIPTMDGQPPNGYTFAPNFSGDGRFLAFVSNANNLVAANANEMFAVFLWDRETRKVELISAATGDVEVNGESGMSSYGEGYADELTISADGRYIAYASTATNLTTESVNECADFRGFQRPCYNIYLHDRETRSTRLVTTNASGDSLRPNLSADGRFLVFTSVAQNLTVETWPCQFPAIGSCGQVFLYDAQTGEMALISRAVDGTPGNGPSYEPALSADGRFVTFSSTANNLVANDTNDASDIFRLDRDTGQMERISVP